MKELKAEKIILGIIVLFAVLVRMRYFGIHRFSMDESLYAGWAMRMFDRLDLLLNGVPGIDKPPLLFYLQALAFALFGVSENAARLPSAAAGIGNLLLVFTIARHYFTARAGLLAAFLLAASPFVLAYDNSAYPDSVMMFTCLLGMVFITQRKWALAGLAAGLALATKQYGIFFFPLLLGYTMIEARDPGLGKSLIWNEAIKK